MSQEKLIPGEFTPSGGMNQDDSICTPTPGLEGGVSLFQNGDYRYALNMRIGSSRDDSMGDGELIKSTRKVDKYYVFADGFQNPDFNASLSPWLQIVQGGGWTWGSVTGEGAAINTEINQTIIYQPFDGSRNDVSISYTYSMQGSAVSGFILQAVYLNNTSILSTQDLDTRTGASLADFKKTVTLNVPVGCNGIGLRVLGTKVGPLGSAVLRTAQIRGWFSSSKPFDINKTIGKYQDEEFLKVWHCIADTDAIRSYNLTDDAIYEVIKWQGLKWSTNSYVKMAKLDNWIALTDRVNPPRLINTDTITNLFISLGDKFREFHIAFHKWSPVGAPIIKSYYDGSTNNGEKIRDKMWQFSYRYIYRGNLQSRWSPISVAASTLYDDTETGAVRPITGFSVYMPGLFLDNEDISISYNYFNHGDVKCTSVIESMQIAVRDSEIGVWRLWKSISPTTTAQIFNGTLDNTYIPNEDFDQPFDTVPFLAGTIEAIDNRFVFGDILDEQSPAEVPTVTNIDVVLSDPGVVNWNTPVASIFTGIVNTSDRNELADRNAAIKRTFKGRGIYKLGIQYLAKSGWRSAVYTNNSWVYTIPDKTSFDSAEPQAALTFRLGSKPPVWAVAYQIVRTNCLNIDSFMYGVCNEIVPIIDDLSKQISGINDVSPDLATAIRDHFLNASSITGKEYDDYLQVLANNPIYTSIIANLRKTRAAQSVTSGSRLFINIRNWYNGSKKDASGNIDNPLNNLIYNYRPGDRVRFIGSEISSPSNTQKKIYDLKIVEFTGDGIIVERPGSINWVPTQITTISSVSFKDYLIEVYTPREQSASDLLFYESGEWYPVLNPGFDSRTWSKSDWVYTNVAAITASKYGDILVFNKHPFYFGDCSQLRKFMYNDFRANGTGISYSGTIPSMNNVRNNTYGRWEHSNGRVYPAYTRPPVQKFKTTTARFTGKIVEQSFINNINRMRDEDQFVYPSEYGRIRDLINTNNAQVESVGAVLLAIGERESWSIYVNRTTSEDLSGRTQVLLSDRVLGSFNALLGSYGTFNPESVTRNRGRVYWWCQFYGAWIRYGRDGLTEISSYKMRTWFKQLSDLIMNAYQSRETLLPPKVISGFDAFNEELVTTIDSDLLPSTFRGYDDFKGSLFSENDKRWKSCHNYNPDMFASLGNKLFLFQDGDVLVHEEGEDYLVFAGVKYPAKIEPVFNMLMKDMKAWRNITIIATNPWEIERIQSEYRGQKSIQQSHIPLSQVKDKEDTYYAPIFRDENAVGGALYKGDMMRSKAIKVLLTLDPSVVTRALLHYVMAEFNNSPKNP